MTPLASELERIIRLDGPIGLDRYMALCLGHPAHGYYVTRDPLGRAGDFTTAPEISQMFGELIGVWTLSLWDQMGRPDPVQLIELGPGRGTLMADVLRTARALPEFLDAVQVHLVEMSPVLRRSQARALQPFEVDVSWRGSFADAPGGLPCIIIANEFFDALPIRQIVATQTGWRERMVGLDAAGELCLGLAADAWRGDLPEGKPGDIREICPEGIRTIENIAQRLASDQGALLAIDYGYAKPAAGDSLQAMRDHRFVGVLETPGEADLTAHVDFSALGRAAKAAGARVHPLLTQRALLERLGLGPRMAALQQTHPGRAQEIASAAVRLAGPEKGQMGALFKALAISSPDLSTVPVFDTSDPLIAELKP